MRIRVIEHEDMTVQNFLDRSSARGWTHVGGGGFATAYGVGELVWRVENARHENGENGEDEYDDYYYEEREIDEIAYHRFVMGLATGEISPSPHFPRIKLHVVLADGVATLMERLDATLAAKPQRPWNSPDEPTFNSPRARQGLDRIEHLILALPRSFEATVLRLLRWKNRCADWLNEDLHGNNMMWRRDGTLVITDPFW